ncbi:MAG: hypothetical protein AAGB35_03145 [Pseudomonadota bacterium]
MQDSNFFDSGTPEPISRKQLLFLRYFTAFLIDLVVLNIFAEYWGYVSIYSFTISLFAAALLQLLLQLTLRIEEYCAHQINKIKSKWTTAYRILSAWGILFLSKFIILGAINFLFGEDIVFSGPLHGVVAFIIVIIVMVAAEQIIIRFYRALK